MPFEQTGQQLDNSAEKAKETAIKGILLKRQFEDLWNSVMETGAEAVDATIDGAEAIGESAVQDAKNYGAAQVEQTKKAVLDTANQAAQAVEDTYDQQVTARVEAGKVAYEATIAEPVRAQTKALKAGYEAMTAPIVAKVDAAKAKYDETVRAAQDAYASTLNVFKRGRDAYNAELARQQGSNDAIADAQDY